MIKHYKTLKHALFLRKHWWSWHCGKKIKEQMIPLGAPGGRKRLLLPVCALYIYTYYVYIYYVYIYIYYVYIYIYYLCIYIYVLILS
jgi:hypothetical protein